MNKADIERILTEAINELIQKDNYLLENDVHERTITSKMSDYIRKRILPKDKGGWDVDAEYNRNERKPKSLQSGNVVPDIIIHRRGKNNPNGIEDNNLLVLEIKKHASATEKANDETKIIAFINEAPYFYCYGTFVNFTSANFPEIEWFERNTLF